MTAGAPPVTPAMVEGIMSRALYFVRRDVCIIAEPKAPQNPVVGLDAAGNLGARKAAAAAL